MKHIFQYLCLLLALPLFAACSDEDDLTAQIDFTSPYLIEDDPNDPVQHEVYLLFKEYDVPVYFNDTIQTRRTGTDLQGRPVIQTETIDLNWNFQSHDANSVKYTFDYLTTQDEKLRALEFARKYLSLASKKMRPFCILLVDTLYTTKGGATSKPDYFTNFRTLVVTQTLDLTEEQRAERANGILRNEVLARIKLNDNLMERFGAVSSRDKFYGRPWVNDGINGGLGCKWTIKHEGTFWRPQELWNDGILEEYIMWSMYTHVNNEEQFVAERTSIISQIGKYGFICGDTDNKDLLAHLKSPANVSQDLTFYVTTMLNLGRTEFMARYGGATMVKKKFEILYDYISNELGVNLDF